MSAILPLQMLLYRRRPGWPSPCAESRCPVRALAVRDRLSDEKTQNLAALKTTMTTISSDAAALTDIIRWAKTVKSSGVRIGKKAVLFRKRLNKQLEVLESYLQASFGEVAGEGATGTGVTKPKG
jgi:hypothetical protein